MRAALQKTVLRSTRSWRAATLLRSQRRSVRSTSIPKTKGRSTFTKWSATRRQLAVGSAGLVGLGAGGYLLLHSLLAMPNNYRHHCDEQEQSNGYQESPDAPSTDGAQEEVDTSDLSTATLQAKALELGGELLSIAPSTWTVFTDRLTATKDAILDIDFSVTSVTTPLLTLVLPEWALRLPEWVSRLQEQLTEAPGSLAEELWQEAQDPYLTPEIALDAKVRISADLCPEEKRFLRRRRKYMKYALARYLGLSPEEIHEDDIPRIGITGSGGGLRAMVATAGSFQRAKETGLLDITTYTAGVSGSCWLMAVFYSSIGSRRFDRVIEHLKDRIGTHIAFPPAVLTLLNTAPTNRYLLRGVVERLKVGYSGFHLVDAYGLALAARLMVPRDEMSVDDADLKLSAQRRWIEAGQLPLPIYTAVRHEIPQENEDTPASEEEKERAKQESWFQWFEFTPYEFYCEELEAGIPTWAIGRKFDMGMNVHRNVPELKMPTLFGIFGSAFCATLSHYYTELRPFIRSLPAMFTSVDDMITGRANDLQKIHPITPASVPNYVKGLKDFLPQTCPESLYEAEEIQLMDAGMSNNLACYPLLRPGRDVEVLIAFDSSADIQKSNWLAITEGYAKQRKISGWPVNIGWPKSTIKSELQKADKSTPEEAADKLEEAQERDSKRAQTGDNLGYCTVWVGTKEERQSDEEPPPSKYEDDDFILIKPTAGVTVVYFPLIPNPKVPGVDPEVCTHLSTWNFEWTNEQIDSTVALAQANFDEGSEKLRRTIRAVYERKRKLRLDREQQMREQVQNLRKRWDKVEERLNERRIGLMDHFIGSV